MENLEWQIEDMERFHLLSWSTWSCCRHFPERRLLPSSLTRDASAQSSVCWCSCCSRRCPSSWKYCSEKDAQTARKPRIYSARCCAQRPSSCGCLRPSWSGGFCSWIGCFHFRDRSEWTRLLSRVLCCAQRSGNQTEIKRVIELPLEGSSFTALISKWLDKHSEKYLT